MRLKPSFALILLTLLTVCCNRGFAQANVTENQTTYLYVDAQYGNDGNSGVSDAPFKTIQAAVTKAVSNVRSNVGTKVIVNAGTYRETVNVPSFSSNVALTVEAASNGTAIISGSDVLTGWEEEAGSIPIYHTYWGYKFGECEVPSGWPSGIAPIALRTEMVFVNGVALTQVMSYSDLHPGTFFINEAYDVIHVSPATGTDMSTAVVEASTRSQTLNMSGAHNAVLRGLVFQHAATCVNQSGANITSSNNVLLDHVQATWNNWGGLAINTSSNFTVQDSVASYNGGVGFQANKDTNALYNSNETDYNNWRGAQTALYDWAMGGLKMMWMRNAEVENHLAYRNQAQGLWYDTDNENVSVLNSTVAGSTVAALQIERNEGPVLVENSKFCSSGTGINILTSEGVTIKNNVLYNNSGTNKNQAAIFLGGTNGGQGITNYLTGAYIDLFTTGTIVSGNTIEDAASGQTVFGTYLSSSDWAKFTDSLSASSNGWYDPTNAYAFKVVNGKYDDLSEWQGAVGGDYSSWWGAPETSPASACGIPTPALSDFTITADSNIYTMSSAETVSTLRLNSFGFGTVALRVEGVPANVSAALSSTSLVSGTVTLTLKANEYAATEQVPITVFATGTNRVHSVTFYVNVAP